jgi:NADH/NAD ratio-sensing transcriptional regulator Rex
VPISGHKYLRELAKTEAQRIGVAELARRINADPSNLRKAINGEREFGLELQRAVRRITLRIANRRLSAPHFYEELPGTRSRS